MRLKEIFVAEDGTEFDTPVECRAYEANLFKDDMESDSTTIAEFASNLSEREQQNFKLLYTRVKSQREMGESRGPE